MAKQIKNKKKRLLISKKKLIINIIIILVVTGLTIYTLLSKGTFDDLSPLKNITWFKFFIIVGMCALFVLLEGFIIYRQFRRINPKMSYLKSCGAYLYANLGSNITPAKTGHHPFRIYYLEREGNSFAQSLANATQCQIIYTIVQFFFYGAMAIVSLALGLNITLFGSNVPLYLVGLIGISLAFIASGIFIVMAYVPPIRKILIRILAWFNVKTKKFKTKEEYIAIQEEKMRMLREQIVLMFTHFWETIPSIIVYSIQLTLSNCFPYFIYLLITSDPNVHFEFGTMCYYFALFQCISYVSNIVPIPGNSGGAERLFLILYATVIPNQSELNCTLLMWRLFSYYLFVIFEAVYFVISSVAHDAKKEVKLQKILHETTKGWTPEVHSHFDTMEMELLSVNFKNTQCYNCCHLQNNLFQCDKYKDKPNEILQNKIRCPFYEERDNGEDL